MILKKLSKVGFFAILLGTFSLTVSMEQEGPLTVASKTVDAIMNKAKTDAIKKSIDAGSFVADYRDTNPEELKKVRVGMGDEDTLLHYAIDRGEPFQPRKITQDDQNVLIFLLETAGFDINTQGAFGDTPLHRAIRMSDGFNNDDTIIMLLKRKPDLSITNRSNNNIHQISKTYNLNRLIEQELKKNAQATSNNLKPIAPPSKWQVASRPSSPQVPTRSQSPAVTRQNGSPRKEMSMDLSTLLTSMQMTRERLEEKMDSAIRHAEVNDLIAFLQLHPEVKDILRSLLGQRINVTKRGIQNNSTSYLGHFIDLGFKDPNPEFKTTPQQRNMMRVLILNGAQVDMKDSYGNTPLMQAVRVKDIPAIKLLLASDANMYAFNRDGQTAKILAEEEGIKLEQLKNDALKEKNSALEHQAIITAISEKNRETFASLIQKYVLYGGDINSKENTGKTFLCYALEADATDIVQLLLENGANTDIRCNGKSAFQVAKEKGINLAIMRTNVERSHRQSLQKLPTIKTEDAKQLLAKPGSRSKRAAMMLPKGFNFEQLIQNFENTGELDFNAMTPEQLSKLQKDLQSELSRRSQMPAQEAAGAVAAARAATGLLGKMSWQNLQKLEKKLDEELRRSNISIQRIEKK